MINKKTGNSKTEKKTVAAKSAVSKKNARKDTKPKASYRSNKKPAMEARKNVPSTVAERNARKGSHAREDVIGKINKGLKILCAGLFAGCLFFVLSIFYPNLHRLTQWGNDIAGDLGGRYAYLFFIGAALTLLWVMIAGKSGERKTPWKIIIFVFLLLFYLAILRQIGGKRMNPPLTAREGGGIPAEWAENAIRALFGDSGLIILMVFLGCVFLLIFWSWASALYREHFPKELDFEDKTARRANAYERNDAYFGKSGPIRNAYENNAAPLDSRSSAREFVYQTEPGANLPMRKLTGDEKNSDMKQAIFASVKKIAQSLNATRLKLKTRKDEINKKTKTNFTTNLDRLEIEETQDAPFERMLDELGGKKEIRTESIAPVKMERLPSQDRKIRLSNQPDNETENENEREKTPKTDMSTQEAAEGIIEGDAITERDETSEGKAISPALFHRLNSFPEAKGVAPDEMAFVEKMSNPKTEPEKMPLTEKEIENKMEIDSEKDHGSEELFENGESVKKRYKFTMQKTEPEAIPEKASDTWALPDLDLILDPIIEQQGLSPEDPQILELCKVIEDTLARHKAPGIVVEVLCGPTFTQFGVEPGFIGKTRVRVKQIEEIAKDLQMDLSVEKVGIIAPIPGKTYVGIQILNRKRVTVTLREIIEHSNYCAKRLELGIALGKDVSGRVHIVDLTRMPHLLIAGATGSGKSVCLNSILTNLLLFNTPEQLKLILIDPKRVELARYNGIPHLISPVVTDVDKAYNVLQWALREMDMRNTIFLERGARNIQEYNRNFPAERMQYIVVVIDELANLMMEAASDIETSLVRLAQTARAMGIHLIVATQRPSRDVITGTIKGNLPTRIAFAVSQPVDSQVILDRQGAFDLFGGGDMLFLSAEEKELVRMQCGFVSDKEIERLMNFWRHSKPCARQQEAEGAISAPAAAEMGNSMAWRSDLVHAMPAQAPLFNEKEPNMGGNEDALLQEAIKLVRRSKKASASLLVSRLSIGYGRANKLLAMMEDSGIISGPNANPAIPRTILDYEDASEDKTWNEE